MTEPSVSVVIPAYKAAGTIGVPVRSLLAQTRGPDEILVVDDGSPDDLAAALAPFGPAVTLVRKPNGGAASARNLGIERARGNLIAFLDADDYWEPTKLERQLAALAAHPGAGLVGCRWYEEPPGGTRQLAVVDDERFFGRVVRPAGREAFDVAMNVWTSTVLVRREVLGDLRFVSGLEPAEDRDLWVRLAAAAPLYLLPEPLATYVLVPGSLSRGNVDRDCGNMLRVVHRHAAVLGPRGVWEQEAVVYRRWAAGHLGDRRPRAALLPAGRRLRRQPYSLQAWWIVLKALAWGVVTRHGLGGQQGT